MNISASNQSLENIIIRQEKEKKRPSFASVFEKINKRTSNMNRITPLNNKLTNEQLFRYYLKETDPKLRVSDDAFGEDETTLADLITNRSLNKSKVNQTIQSDDGDVGDGNDDEGKDDASTRNVDEYLRIVEEINDEKQQDQSQSFVDRSSFFLDPKYSLKSLKSLEHLDNINDSLLEAKNYLARMNSETFVNDEFKDDINPMYEGSTDDFVSSLVGYTPDTSPKKIERLQNSLIEAGVDPKEIENISPIKKARTIKPVQPTELVNQLVGAKTYSKELGPEKIDATWEEKRDHTANELYYLQRGKSKPLSFENLNYYVREDPLWRPTDRTGDWKAWAKGKYDKEGASTAISSVFKGYAVRNRNRIREVKGIVNDLVDDVMGKAVTDAVSLTAVVKRGRPAGSKNKPITPTNMRTRSSKAINPETEGFV